MLLTTTNCKNKPDSPLRQVIRALRGPASIELLEKTFLHDTTGVTFIAIDFEYLPAKGNVEITEIGISTLSTDKWRQFPPVQKNIIHSQRHFTSKAPRSGLDFLFGESERILKRNIPQFLKDTLCIISLGGIPHKIVLVGQSTPAELDILEKIGINLADNDIFAIEGILDISTIIRGGLGHEFAKRPSLARILEFLGIPYQQRYLHNAGNDAHFTLRAFLTLAAAALERLDLEDLQRARVADLKMIALEPIDFVSQTPDGRLWTDDKAKKAAAARCGVKQKPVTEVADDWWDGLLEELLGTTIFELTADSLITLSLLG
jgi:hypothetical protein